MKGVKKPTVCMGCKYFVDEHTSLFRGQCKYSDVKGRSRLVVEYKNGGYKEDSCCCYEVKKRGRKKKTDDNGLDVHEEDYQECHGLTEGRK